MHGLLPRNRTVLDFSIDEQCVQSVEDVTGSMWRRVRRTQNHFQQWLRFSIRWPARVAVQSCLPRVPAHRARSMLARCTHAVSEQL